MELVNEFVVNKPVEQAWPIITDVERIAPCLPGAQLTEIEGDVYRGHVKVKVGPIQAQFKGQAVFIERDDEHHNAVLKADGRDTGGKGNASARITAQPRGDRRRLVALFGAHRPRHQRQGRPVRPWRAARHQQEADRPVRQQPQHHDRQRRRDGPCSWRGGRGRCDRRGGGRPRRDDRRGPLGGWEAPTGAAAAGAPTLRTIDSAPAEPIDLVGTAGPTMAKRILPLIGHRHHHVLPAAPASPAPTLRLSAMSAPLDAERVRDAARREPKGGFEVAAARRRGGSDRDPQRAAARRRHPDADRATGSSGGPRSSPSAGWRPPAGSTGPKPRSGWRSSPTPTGATRPSATPPSRPTTTDRARPAASAAPASA